VGENQTNSACLLIFVGVVEAYAINN